MVTLLLTMTFTTLFSLLVLALMVLQFVPPRVRSCTRVQAPSVLTNRMTGRRYYRVTTRKFLQDTRWFATESPGELYDATTGIKCTNHLTQLAINNYLSGLVDAEAVAALNRLLP